MIKWIIVAMIGVMPLGVQRALGAPPSPDYELLYEDHFSSGTINEKDWTYRTGRRTGGNMDGLNRKENVSVSGGGLHIAVRQELIGGKLDIRAAA